MPDPVLYPHYARWLILLTQRNIGVIAVVVIAALAVAMLVEGKWLMPRWMPMFRLFLFVGYAILFVLSLLGALGGVS